MPYVEGRTVHDADAHIMEEPAWLMDYADSALRERMAPMYDVRVAPGELDMLEKFREQHRDPEFRSHDAEEIMNRKNWKATGSFIKEDRPLALDLLGFQSQLIFNTFHNGHLNRLEHGDDVDLAYGAAEAHNRGMLDFCSVD